MIVAKATLSLIILSLLAKESPDALHSSLRGFSLEVEKREKPGILFESEEQKERTRSLTMFETSTGECFPIDSTVRLYLPGDGDSRDRGPYDHYGQWCVPWAAPADCASVTPLYTAGPDGAPNTAFDFSPANRSAFIKVDDPVFDETLSFSMAFWFRATNFAIQRWQSLLVKGPFAEDWTMGVHLYADGGYLLVGFPSCNMQTPYQSIVQGEWYHVAVTYDMTMLKMIVNGIDGHVHESNINCISPATAVHVDSAVGVGGKGKQGNWPIVSGALDEIVIFDRALSGGELELLREGGMCRDNGEPAPEPTSEPTPGPTAAGSTESTVVDLLDTVSSPKGDDQRLAFGQAIALSADGSCLVVGEPHIGRWPKDDTGESGKVYVYRRQQGSTWNRTAVLSDEEGRQELDRLGESVAVSADCKRIVAGAPADPLYERVVVFDLNEVLDQWQLTARLAQGTVLANGDLLDLPSEPHRAGFGRSVGLSGDGHRIAIDVAATNGGVYDVDLEGNIMPVCNCSASAISADGTTIVTQMFEDLGGVMRIRFGLQFLDFDTVSGKWTPNGHGVATAERYGSVREILMNGSGSRAFVRLSVCQQATYFDECSIVPEIFVIDDVRSGFELVEVLSDVAEQAGLELKRRSLGLFAADNSGKFAIWVDSYGLSFLVFREKNGQWAVEDITVPGPSQTYNHVTGMLSADGTTMAVTRIVNTRIDFQTYYQRDVSIFGISTVSGPVQSVEPTLKPTPAPTIDFEGVTVELVGEIDGPPSPWPYEDPFPRNIALTSDGRCLIASYVHAWVDEHTVLREGRILLFELDSMGKWLQTAEFRDNALVFDSAVAVSANCSRVAFSAKMREGPPEWRVLVYDRAEDDSWKKTVELRNGTTFANGGVLSIPSYFARYERSLSTLPMSNDGSIIMLVVDRRIYVLRVTTDGAVFRVGDVIPEINPDYGTMSANGTRIVVCSFTSTGTGAAIEPLKQFTILDYDDSAGEWIEYSNVVTSDRFAWQTYQQRVLYMNGAGDQFIFREHIASGNETVLVFHDNGKDFDATDAADLLKIASKAGAIMDEQPYQRVASMARSKDVVAVLSPTTAYYTEPSRSDETGRVLLFRKDSQTGVWKLAAKLLPPTGVTFPGPPYFPPYPFQWGDLAYGVEGSGASAISLSSDASILAVKIADPGYPYYLRNSGVALYKISYDDDLKPTPCGPGRERVCVDFSTTEDRALTHGDYVERDWSGTYGMTLAVRSFNGGYTAQGARIFDTSLEDTRDPDLGSPNEQCYPAGPGVGLGGIPGAPGENCVAQGNVLIVQQDNGPDDTDPDDNAYGGTIEFMFDDEGRKVLSIGMLDVDHNATLEIRKNDGSSYEINIEGLGDNALQEETIDEENVSSLSFSIAESGAVSYLCFCDDPTLERVAVQLIPSELAIPAPGKKVAFLVMVKHHAGDSDVTITTILETSVGDLNGKGTCSTPQTIAPDGEYSCTFPSTVTGLSGTTVTKIVAATGINNEGIPLLDTATAVVSLIGPAPEPQETCIRFDETPYGTKLNHGDWIKDQWFDEYGMMITAASTDGGYTPDGQARIFDTKLYDTQDVDLGSPNQDCVGGGPGVGHGGIRGAPGENCESQGNVVIIQEHPEANEDYDTLEPDDNAYGGSLTFTFDEPLTKLTRVGLMDIETFEEASYKVTRASGVPVERTITGLGDNSVQEEMIDVDNVTSLELTVSNSIGVRYICFNV